MYNYFTMYIVSILLIIEKHRLRLHDKVTEVPPEWHTLRDYETV